MIQKIRQATMLFFNNWKLLSSIVLTVWLPGSILLVYLRLYVFPATAGGDELKMVMQEMRVSNIIEIIFGPFYVGALIYAASRITTEMPVNYVESMTHAASRSFKLLGTRIGTGLIVLVGLIALIIPGVVLALRFALIDPVVVLEDREGASARNLSIQLTKGKRWNILGTMILAFIGIVLGSFLISFLLYLPLSFIGQTENFVIAVITECAVNILTSIPILILFLFYKDAKDRQLVSLSRTEEQL